MAKEKDYHFDRYAKFRNRLIFAVLVSLVVFSLIYFLFLEKDVARIIARIGHQNGTTAETNATTNATAACGDDCLLKLALTTSNSSYCNNMSAARSDECWQIFSNSDISACLALKNYSLLGGCVNDFASFTRNTTLCSYLQPQDRAACVEKVNPPCMNVSLGPDRELCLAYRYNSTSYCTQSACFLAYAVKRNYPAACANLSSDSERYACESLLSGENRCSFLAASKLDYCYQLLAQYSGDYSYCTGITGSTYKANCLLTAAITAKNMSYCALNDLEQLPDCYVNYSIATGDVQGCLALNNTYLTGSRDGCLNTLAKGYTEPAACNYASTVYIKMTCYGDSILTHPENLSLGKCAGVAHPGWQDKCYSAYAKAANDPSICDFVQDSSAKNSCVAGISP
ncbi:Uncharacterised protein [uncultured archaeon]|nr:Uncharacterised protein [uncultured archaeon]